MAAGLGFKTFVTGDVLTAADTNGYLMQGVLVFASAAARDSAITSPQEGQFAYTKDTNGLWYYDGAAWVASGAAGDIEGVTAGTGISGGGTSGTVTITNSMATAIDAKGDLVVGTGADTFSRLAVGTNDYVLTADSTEATGMKWAAAGGGGSAASYSLINTGGTSLTGGTTTVSGISGMSSLLILVRGGSTAGATEVKIRFNTDTGSNYNSAGAIFAPTTISPASYTDATALNAVTCQSAANTFAMGISVHGANSTGFKAVNIIAATNGATASNESYMSNGIYVGTSTISSVSIVGVSQNLDAGTIYVYGSAV
jgi:hypothetical protein